MSDDLPTREQFIRASMAMLGDTRERAGEVYDLLTDTTPEGDRRFREALAVSVPKMIVRVDAGLPKDVFEFRHPDGRVDRFRVTDEAVVKEVQEP